MVKKESPAAAGATVSLVVKTAGLQTIPVVPLLISYSGPITPPSSSRQIQENKLSVFKGKLLRSHLQRMGWKPMSCRLWALLMVRPQVTENFMTKYQ